jgi:hypothetical protein
MVKKRGVKRRSEEIDRLLDRSIDRLKSFMAASRAYQTGTFVRDGLQWINRSIERSINSSYDPPMRPSHLWKELPSSTRLALADAFWRENDDDSPETTMQHVEAIAAIARRMNFRTKSVQALPIDRKARQLAQMSDVSDAVATRALIAYHFSTQRPMMAAFLNALGVANDNGLITAEEVAAPETEQLRAAVGQLGEYPADAVSLYLRTLTVVDEDTWRNLPAVIPPTP